MKKIKLNLNQRKAISDLSMNLSNSIITLGVIIPLLAGNILNIKNIVNFVITIVVSTILVLLSNILLK
ncbi:MAG: hypothetical protein AAB441_03235 [Patescibacteria group bacterium]